MPITGSNNWGSYSANDGLGDEFPNYAPPEGTATPSAPVMPPQSPSGVITGAQTVPNGPTSRMSPAAFNYDESESSTEAFLSEFGVPAGIPADDGAYMTADALTAPVVIAGLPAVAISQNSWQSSCVAPVQQ